MGSNYKVDYHTHSYYSDGTMSPVELVRKYHDDEYDVVALTDHDGIDGLMEAVTAGEALKMQVVTGIELATEFEGHELHLLGYRFDRENEALKAKCAELKEIRRERNIRLIEKLNEMGYELTLEELEKKAPKGYVGKPNIARLLEEKGYISNYSEAFEPGKILEAPEIKKIRRKKMDTADAINLIIQAGGTPVLAHPGKIKTLGEKGTKEYSANMEQLVKKLKKAGLKGIECYHPSHNEEESFAFVQLAAKYHLHITEGSDFHG